MSLLRWIPTFLAFPLAGLSAMLIFGSISNPLIAAAAGLLAGAVIGGAQWLALGRTVDWRWPVASAAAVAAGMTIAGLVVGPPTTPVAAITAGAVSGVLLGLAQGWLLNHGIRTAALWTAVVGASWTLGWIVTSLVIVDIDRGHVVFGASGAILVTLITGVTLRLVLGPRPRTQSAPVSAEVTPNAGV